MVIIAEPGSELAASLLPWLTKKGYRFQAVDDIEDIVISLVSRNKISVILLDDSVDEGTLCEDIAIIKRMSGNVPIIVTTEENHPEKEECIRKEGIFYYHIKSLGMDNLKTAISCAMQDAIKSHLSWAQVRWG